MGKHDKDRRAKQARNELYAKRFRQKVCKDCKHRSSKSGRCAVCGGKMNPRRKAAQEVQ